MIWDYSITVSLFDCVLPFPKVGDKIYEDGLFLGIVIDICESSVIVFKRGRIVNPANFEEIVQIPFEECKICTQKWNVHYNDGKWSFTQCQ